MIARFLRWLRKACSRTPRRAPADPAGLGRFGEDQAARWLRRGGYTILTRNAVVPSGELDIVALKGETVAVVEVRTRRGAIAVAPGDTVTTPKQRKVMTCAREFVAYHKLVNVYLRFDIVAVEVTKDGTVARIDHFKRAFEPHAPQRR